MNKPEILGANVEFCAELGVGIVAAIMTAGGVAWATYYGCGTGSVKENWELYVAM
jgi:hypothetical protein